MGRRVRWMLVERASLRSLSTPVGVMCMAKSRRGREAPNWRRGDDTMMMP